MQVETEEDINLKMSDPRPALKCGQVTVQNCGERQDGGHRNGGKEEEKKI